MAQRKTVYWRHTGIEAPLHLWVQNLKELPINGGLVSTADLVHPEHGVVGEVFNEGRGGETRFESYDPSVFTKRDLDELARHSREDGKPLPCLSGTVLTEVLLNAAVDETATQHAVDEAKTQGAFLVRGFQPARPDAVRGVADRSVPVKLERPLWTRSSRERFVDAAAERPGLALRDTQIWQMFTGQEWLPLLRAPRYTPDEQAARMATITQHDPATNGPLADGMYVWGAACFTSEEHRLEPDKSYRLVADDGLVLHREWCRCGKRRPRRVRFELWNTDHGILGAGEVHAAWTCRRLLSIE